MATVAILGTGLIGASVAMALRGQGWTAVGWDPDPGARAAALAVGALDHDLSEASAAIDLADLVVLAGPPGAIVTSLPGIATDRLVVDVAGAKSDIVAAAAHLARFVGTHPMAGREHAGADAASPALFRGAAWVIVEDGAARHDLDEVESLIQSIGAVPVRMSAAAHDAAVAAISHLPQVVAAALVAQAAHSPEAMELTSGSFRDLTRVALSDPGMWADLLLANRAQVVAAVDHFAEQLAAWKRALAAMDGEWLRAELARSRETRRTLAPPMVAVGVLLEDRPGELAGVGRALAVSRVDVRDLQLRHGRHGGGGVLTLSVRPGEAEALRTALAAEGFTLD